MADGGLNVLPDLSLGTAGSVGSGLAGPGANPLGIVSSVQGIQRQNIENQQLSLALAARQRAGQIAAAAPTPEAAAAAMSADPQVAAFAPELATNARQAQMYALQNQGTQAKQGADAFSSVVQGAAAAAADPSTLDANIAQRVGLLPKALQAQIAPQVQAFTQSLKAGLPSDPDAAKAQYQARLAAQLTAIGSPDMLKGVLGTPETRPLGTGSATGVAPAAGMPGYGSFQPKTFLPGAPTNLPTGIPGQVQPQVLPAPQVQQLDGNGVGAPGNPLMPPGTGSAYPGAPVPVAKPAPVSPPTAGTEAEQAATTSGAAGVNTLDEISGGVKGLTTSMNRVDALSDALGRFTAGGGSSTGAAAAQALQAIQRILPGAISNDLINKVAGGQLSAQQVFNSNIRSQALRALSSDIAGQGHAFMPEVQSALESQGPNMSPEALLQLLNQTKLGYATAFDQAKKVPMFRAMVSGEAPNPEHYKAQDFYTWYADKYGGPASLPTGNTGGGLGFAPTQPAEVKGIAPGTTLNTAGAAVPAAGVRKVYDPVSRTFKLVPGGGQ